MLDRKSRHFYDPKQNDHDPEWWAKPIITESDQQDWQQRLIQVEDYTEDPCANRYKKLTQRARKVDFNDLLDQFEALKKRDIDEGRELDWKYSNMRGRINRFRAAIIATKGLQNAAVLSDWLSKYKGIRPAATRRNNLNLLKLFLKEFLCRAMTANANLINFQSFNGYIDNLIRREQKGKKARS